MRQRYLRSPTVQNYSIIVRDVPKEIDCRTVGQWRERRETWLWGAFLHPHAYAPNFTDPQLRSYLESILGEEITAIHPVNGHRRRRYEYWLGRKETVGA